MHSQYNLHCEFKFSDQKKIILVMKLIHASYDIVEYFMHTRK